MLTFFLGLFLHDMKEHSVLYCTHRYTVYVLMFKLNYNRRMSTNMHTAVKQHDLYIMKTEKEGFTQSLTQLINPKIALFCLELVH